MGETAIANQVIRAAVLRYQKEDADSQKRALDIQEQAMLSTAHTCSPLYTSKKPERAAVPRTFPAQEVWDILEKYPTFNRAPPESKEELENPPQQEKAMVATLRFNTTSFETDPTSDDDNYSYPPLPPLPTAECLSPLPLDSGASGEVWLDSLATRYPSSPRNAGAPASPELMVAFMADEQDAASEPEDTQPPVAPTPPPRQQNDAHPRDPPEAPSSRRSVRRSPTDEATTELNEQMLSATGRIQQRRGEIYGNFLKQCTNNVNAAEAERMNFIDLLMSEFKRHADTVEALQREFLRRQNGTSTTGAYEDFASALCGLRAQAAMQVQLHHEGLLALRETSRNVRARFEDRFRGLNLDSPPAYNQNQQERKEEPNPVPAMAASPAPPQAPAGSARDQTTYMRRHGFMNPPPELIHSMFMPGATWNSTATRVAQQSAECIVVTEKGKTSGKCYHHPLCNLHVDKTNGCYYSKIRTCPLSHAKALGLRQPMIGACCGKHWSDNA